MVVPAIVYIHSVVAGVCVTAESDVLSEVVLTAGANVIFVLAGVLDAGGGVIGVWFRFFGQDQVHRVLLDFEECGDISPFIGVDAKQSIL